MSGVFTAIGVIASMLMVLAVPVAALAWFQVEREAREREQKRRAFMDGLVGEGPVYWTSDRQLDWAICGPTPDKYWERESEKEAA